jgi:hypothetical protein
MAAAYNPPTLAEIQAEITRLRGLITTYENQIKGFQSDKKVLQANTAAQQVIINNILKSSGNTKTVSNWTGVTSYTADVGYVTTLVSPPTNNSTRFYIPAGADVNFEYNIGTTNVLRIGRPIYKINNWINPSYTYHPAKTLVSGEWYRNQTIDIQWNLSDVVISMEHDYDIDRNSKPTGKVLLFNRKTKNYVRIQLMLPQKSAFCGVNVFFASGQTLGLVARRSPNPNYTQSCTYRVTAGDIGYVGTADASENRGAGTYYWWNTKASTNSFNIPLRDPRNTFNSMPYDNKLSYASFGPESSIYKTLPNIDKNAYYFKNTGIVQAPLVTSLQLYKNIIVANDKAINALDVRIKDTTKQLNDSKIKLVAQQNLADKYVAPVVVTPVVPVVPGTVINNNTTTTSNINNVTNTNNTTNVSNITNTTNVTNINNINATATTINNINQTFYNVNTGTAAKPTTPTIQLPPPINIAALLAALFGKR